MSRARVKVPCPICNQPVALTDEGRFWRHGSPRCRMAHRRPQRHLHARSRRITLTPEPDTYNPRQGAA